MRVSRAALTFLVSLALAAATALGAASPAAARPSPTDSGPGGFPPGYFNPFGTVDAVTHVTSSSYRVAGWAATANATGMQLNVHVTVDGALAAYGVANQFRGDVGAAMPGYGPAHGYALTVPVYDGWHTMCVHAMNFMPTGQNTLLGCRAVEGRVSPIGNFEEAAPMGLRGIRATGWVLDPDEQSEWTSVKFTVDGAPAADLSDPDLPTEVWAVDSRPDVAAVFPAAYDEHGFSPLLGMPWPGRHVVCATAVNLSGTLGRDASLGCRTVVGPTQMIGQFDAATGTPGGVRVQGWALDALVPGPAVQVHVYIDGLGAAAVSADASRTDVGGVFPEAGAAHGFDSTVGAAPGPHRVCVYAIYADSRAANPSLGCRDVVVT